MEVSQALNATPGTANKLPPIDSESSTLDGPFTGGVGLTRTNRGLGVALVGGASDSSDLATGDGGARRGGAMGRRRKPAKRTMRPDDPFARSKLMTFRLATNKKSHLQKIMFELPLYI